MPDQKLIDHIKAGAEAFGSQAAMARAAKRAKSTVSDWIAGRHKPDAVALMNMDEVAKRKRLGIRFRPQDVRPELF